MVELQGTWPSKICTQAVPLVHSIVQLDNKGTPNAEVKPKEKKDKKKKKKKGKGTTEAKETKETKEEESEKEGKDEPDTPRTTEEPATESSEKPAEANSNAAPKDADKMSVVRCGVVRILAAIADQKVSVGTASTLNGQYIVLDTLAEDPSAWHILSDWFLRFSYASILCESTTIIDD